MAFERFYVTSRGKMLEARVHSGEQIEYTKIALGSGQLADGQSIEALTELITPIKDIPISSVESSGRQAVVMALVTNLGISTSFVWREIGLFAIDPVDGEILYAYANAGSHAENIPAYSTAPTSFYFSFNITFENTSNVEVIADTSLAIVTHEELEAGLATKPSRNVYDVTIPATGWMQQASGLYSLTVPLTGIEDTDSCGNVGPVQTGDETVDKEVRKSWNRIIRMEAAADSVVAYASKAPTVAIPLRMEIFR